MHTLLRLNQCAGDGIGIERSVDNGETWNQDGYINTGATHSTVKLGQEIVKAVNCHDELLGALEAAADFAASMTLFALSHETRGKMARDELRAIKTAITKATNG